jgi:hypothetical protein
MNDYKINNYKKYLILIEQYKSQDTEDIDSEQTATIYSSEINEELGHCATCCNEVCMILVNNLSANYLYCDYNIFSKQVQ